jgi:hypothetical protein
MITVDLSLSIATLCFAVVNIQQGGRSAGFLRLKKMMPHPNIISEILKHK